MGEDSLCREKTRPRGEASDRERSGIGKSIKHSQNIYRPLATNLRAILETLSDDLTANLRITFPLIFKAFATDLQPISNGLSNTEHE
jgi:hypothetical protein